MKELLKSKIIDYISENEGTSFVEIEDIFEECGFDYAGDYVITHSKYPSIIYWINWSEEAIAIFNDIKAEGNIMIKVCDPIIYIIDGKAPNMEVVTEMKNYKKERWLPVAFSTE